MADQKDGGIAWCDETWNPLRGCSKISPGCKNCYAADTASRWSGPGMPYEGLAANGNWTGEVRLITGEVLERPLRWRRPRRVFVNSMSDVFHDAVPNKTIAALFGIMAAAKQHTFQVLTKRSKRLPAWFNWLRGEATRDAIDSGIVGNWPDLDWALHRICYNAALEVGVSPKLLGEFPEPRLSPSTNRSLKWPIPNIWLGVSVENQEAYDSRIEHLMDAEAAVRFLSCEPLLEPIDFEFDAFGYDTNGPQGWVELERPDWVIVGAESGPDARPMDPDWARSIRDQCAQYDIAFFAKQLTGPGGKPLKELDEFPEDLRIREFPGDPGAKRDAYIEQQMLAMGFEPCEKK